MPRDKYRLRTQKRASAKVHQAIRKGIIPKLDGSIACADCGATATCYDHRDYGKPLDVVPVCHTCNLRRGPAHPFRKSGDVGTEKRTNVDKLRFNDAEYALLVAAAKAVGMKPAIFARTVAVESLVSIGDSTRA